MPEPRNAVFPAGTMKQSYPLNPFDDAQPDATSKDSSGRLVCRNARGHERVEVDFNQRTVLFANCHQSRSGLGLTERELICGFEDICGVRDFLVGQHRGAVYRLLFGLAILTGSAVSADGLSSCFISTATGRARIFAGWTGFAEMREALLQISATSAHRPPWSDQAWVGPVVAALALLATAVIVWLLL